MEFNQIFSILATEQHIVHRSEHSVIIHFNNYIHDELDPLHELEDVLRKLIDDVQAGRYDGHEIAMDDTDGRLFMYGPNAEILFKIVKPILENIDFMKGAIATLRFGPNTDGVLEIDVEI